MCRFQNRLSCYLRGENPWYRFCNCLHFSESIIEKMASNRGLWVVWMWLHSVSTERCGGERAPFTPGPWLSALLPAGLATRLRASHRPGQPRSRAEIALGMKSHAFYFVCSNALSLASTFPVSFTGLFIQSWTPTVTLHVHACIWSYGRFEFSVTSVMYRTPSRPFSGGGTASLVPVPRALHGDYKLGRGRL